MESFKRFVKFFFRNPFSESVIIFFSSFPIINRFFFLLRPRYTDYAPNTFRRATRNKIHYELDISDWVEWNIYFKNKIEPREKLYSLVKKDDVVFDIGVNIGETLLNIAARAGEKGKVIGFEPNSIVFQTCKRNIELNPSLKNILLQSFALGEKEEELFVEERDDRNKGMNSLSSSAKGEKVKVIILDSFVQKENFSQLDLIKIDVEGFEMNVLKGAEQTINRFHPKLFIELDDELLQMKKSSAKELVNWLGAHRYRISHAVNNSVISANQSFAHCHFDIICYPVT